MALNWDASELKIKLTPIGKPINRAAKSMAVFKDYGDPRIRVVQAIANMLDGETVYFDSVSEVSDKTRKTVHKEVKQTVPVSGWRGTSNTPDCVANVAYFIERAFSYSMKVECYGASRARWLLEIESFNTTKDAIDNMSDKGLAGDGRTKPVEVVEANGIRVDF